MAKAFTPDDLYNAIQGDFDAFSVLLKQPYHRIEECRSLLAQLVVTREAIRRVLDALQQKRVSPSVVQQWASFVRCGFLASPTPEGPIMPIDIDYEASHEEQIAEVISRLDEIGDLIDGEISSDELSEMIRAMSS